MPFYGCAYYVNFEELLELNKGDSDDTKIVLFREIKCFTSLQNIHL